MNIWIIHDHSGYLKSKRKKKKQEKRKRNTFVVFSMKIILSEIFFGKRNEKEKYLFAIENTIGNSIFFLLIYFAD